jgi:thioredoxin 1
MSEYETINFGFGGHDEPPAKRPNVVYNANQSPFGGIGSSVMGKGVRGGVKNSQEYQSQRQQPTTNSDPFANGKFLIDFYGSWCGPCQKIAPFFDNLESQTPGVTFVKVEIGEQQEIAMGMGVQSVPTFIAMKDGKVIDRLVGGDPVKLKAMANKLKAM